MLVINVSKSQNWEMPHSQKGEGKYIWGNYCVSGTVLTPLTCQMSTLEVDVEQHPQSWLVADPELELPSG